MPLPQVVIVGRPNVGKSSLFNWLVHKRIAIVDGKAGVTRDRLSQLMCVNDRYFELVDTGGMGIEDEDNLTSLIEHQIETAVDSADLLLFVVDTRDGLTPSDEDVAKRLRYAAAPVICVANKTDAPSLDANAEEFYRLGRGKLLRVSARENRGREELLDEIFERLPDHETREPPPEPVMKVAIVGRRNTGKSTLVNTLAQADRVIVSEVPGTTRDSIDVRFDLDGQSFMAIDTPGLRRRKSMTSDIDFYSSHRAERSIRRADVVFLFFDPSERISKVDKQLCDYVVEQFKPCIFVVNKWDLYAGAMPTEKWVNYLHDTFRTMPHVPIAFITGQTGKNVKALLNHGQMLFKQARQRVSTADLNKLLRAAVQHAPPPLYKNREPKIYFATQVGVEPPTLVLFCNNPKALDPTYRRYLMGVFREKLPFGEVPIKLYLRRRESADLSGGRGPEGTLKSDEVNP
jgi:GTPase